MAEESRKVPTISEVEEWMNEWAWVYATKHYSLPRTAFRLFLWPTSKYTLNLISGPTAKINIGLQEGHAIGDKALNDSIKYAIDRIAAEHLYSTMSVAKVVHILSLEGRKHWFKESLQNMKEMLPMLLGDEELSIRAVERIEVIHKATGLREVVEVEQGEHRTTYAARDIAKARLSRRVHEQTKVVKDNTIPFPQSA